MEFFPDNSLPILWRPFTVTLRFFLTDVILDIIILHLVGQDAGRGARQLVHESFDGIAIIFPFVVISSLHELSDGHAAQSFGFVLGDWMHADAEVDSSEDGEDGEIDAFETPRDGLVAGVVAVGVLVVAEES